ncbi:MAG TPA: hypothetical protein VN894_00245 [Polyangiaceae bacterium]|nr:hypothetical protein [Polyangiaceae bacterium]
MAAPRHEDAFVVFAQRADARVDADAWNGHAMRFFATRIGLTTEKRYASGQAAPRTDEASFVVAPDGGPPGVRSTFARPCEAGDYAHAEAADARRGGTGLAILARRCGMVWLVVREAEPDVLALRLAAIFASVFLGPILDPRAHELFGVKTARAKLESPVHRL